MVKTITLCMFHACSIGAEVYSFVIYYLLNGYANYFSIDIQATDLEPNFVEYAKDGRYPVEIIKGLSKDEAAFFQGDGGVVRVVESIRSKVKFIEACSFVEFDPFCSYDIVFLLNGLVYVPGEKQSLTIDKISTYNDCFLLTTAFHMDRIKNDLIRNKYEPIIRNQKNIHDAWTDRRVVTNGNELRPGIYANWSLPEFKEVENFRYIYCSLFKKH